MIGVARVQLDKRPMSTLSQRQVADMEGTTTLPRQSGELLFQDPWEGCVFALAVALCEHGFYAWSEFQNHLIAAIAAASTNRACCTESAGVFLDLLQLLR